MKTAAAAIALLPAIAAAVAVNPGCHPTPPNPPQPNNNAINTGLMALHSASAIHMQAVQACQTGFYVGGGAKTCSTACLLGAKNCPSGTDTVFTYHQGSRVSMDIANPAGQQLYIDSFNRLRYTPADQGTKPIEDIAVTNGFMYKAPESKGSLGLFSFQGKNWLACPQGTAHPTNGQSFQVYADNGQNLEGVEWAQCITFAGGALPYNNTAAAYQYN